MTLSFDGIYNSAKSVVSTLMGTGTSHFKDVSSMDAGQTLLFLVIFVILFVFIMWVGAYIFNHSLVKVFPSVKKISVGDFLGLYIVLHILFC